MRRPIIAAILTAGVAAPLAAAETGCWTRRYDAAHLARNPGQMVREVTLVLARTPGASPFSETKIYREGMLKVDLGDGQAREVSLYCKMAGGGLSCQPSFGEKPILTIAIEAKGRSVLVRNRAIHLNPPGYSAEDKAENAVDLTPGAAHGAFRLPRAAGTVCAL